MRLAVVGFVLASSALAQQARAAATARCLVRAGDAAVACLDGVFANGNGDPAPLAAAVRAACTDAAAFALGWLDLDDAVLRLTDACTEFGAALRTIATPPVALMPGSTGASCAARLAAELDEVRVRTIALFGRQCFVREARRGRCDRPARDRKAAALQARAVAHVQRGCDAATLATLGFADPAPTIVGAAFDRARHYAQFVYPPNDLGPTADIGPYPVGVTTLMLQDPTRPLADGTTPRPVTTEVWYPSTADAVAGVPRYVVNLFGVEIAKTPTHRDVARAPGSFPVVLFSHGNDGIRFQSLFLAAHLASHGYVVASPDHYGNTFLDYGAESLAASAVNRPLDMRFVLDQLIAKSATPADAFAGAIDASRVGMSGHSFGGYTTLALAGGPSADPRLHAFLALAPASSILPDAALAAITAPILIVGGSLDVTTPFAAEQQHAFDLLPSGARVVGLAEIAGAGHFTFSDICEVPRNLGALIGGFDEACTPAHLPWHAAHDLADYLALNFFDATLRGDAKALRRLQPRTLAKLDDLDYERK